MSSPSQTAPDKTRVLARNGQFHVRSCQDLLDRRRDAEQWLLISTMIPMMVGSGIANCASKCAGKTRG